jgi:hypothetical protein
VVVVGAVVAGVVAAAVVGCGARLNASSISSAVRPFFSRNCLFWDSGLDVTCVERRDRTVGEISLRRRFAGREGRAMIATRPAGTLADAHLRVLEEGDRVGDHVLAERPGARAAGQLVVRHGGSALRALGKDEVWSRAKGRLEMAKF